MQMEFCDKSTLRDCIDAGLCLDLERMWRLFRELIEGLAHIHEQVSCEDVSGCGAEDWLKLCQACADCTGKHKLDSKRWRERQNGSCVWTVHR